jgi:dimethylargininase
MNLSRALVRGIGQTYAAATVQTAGLGPIDVGAAVRQHRAYVQALRDAGLRVDALEPEDALPDGCFVEDNAVIAGGRALLTRTGHLGRRGESTSIAAALAGILDCVRQEKGCLEGGDVLRVGRRFFVGQTARSDRAGADALRHAFEPLGYDVVEIKVGDLLHLKCGCSSPTPELVFVAEGSLDPHPFEAVAEVVTVPAAEAYAANLVGLGRRVLIAAGHPRTEALLAHRGLEPIVLDVEQIRRGDGALTCLSLIW